MAKEGFDFNDDNNPFLDTAQKKTPLFYKRKLFFYLLFAAVVTVGVLFSPSIIGFAVAVSVIATGIFAVDLIAYLLASQKPANVEIELDEIALDGDPDAEPITDEELKEPLPSQTSSLGFFSEEPSATILEFPNIKNLPYPSGQ